MIFLVKQVSVFLENKQGRLAEVTKLLSENDVNIRALSIADTTDFGILRLIVNDPELALKVLENSGFTASFKDVLAVGISDEAGSLAKLLMVLQEHSVIIEYMYAFTVKQGNNPLVVLKVSDIEKSAELLKSKGIEVLEEQSVYNL